MSAGPKWLIRRYRRYEAAERVTHGDAVDWAEVADHLGYAKAHLNRDFVAG